MLIAIRTEDQVQDAAPGKLIKPPMSSMSDTGRLFGMVLAVGDPPLLLKNGRLVAPEDLPPPELEFGDVVEITRFAEGTLTRYPLWYFFGEPGKDACRDFAPEDGGPEVYRLTAQHAAGIIEPKHVICRWARRSWTFHGIGEEPSPIPIGDRVMVKNAKPPEKSAGGIILPHWMHRDEPIGEVVSVGAWVDSVAPGDWALMRSDVGTRAQDADGQVYTILHQGDIIGRWDEEPGDEEKLKYSAEITGGQK